MSALSGSSGKIDNINIFISIIKKIARRGKLHLKSINESIAISWFKEHNVDFHKWSNESNTVYEYHEHNYHKVLFCTQGSINFYINSATYALEAGDRLDLPKLTLHKAMILDGGVTCIEGALTTLKDSVLKISKYV